MEQADLVLGAGAVALRRQVGPLAWCALEVLMARGRPASDGSVAPASVRAVADELGVAANTAHRALKTLRTAGLLEHHQSRTDAGFFGVTSYRLIVPFEALRQCSRLPELASPKPSRRRSPAVPSVAAVDVGEQLVLLPSD